MFFCLLFPVAFLPYSVIPPYCHSNHFVRFYRKMAFAAAVKALYFKALRYLKPHSYQRFHCVYTCCDHPLICHQIALSAADKALFFKAFRHPNLCNPYHFSPRASASSRSFNISFLNSTASLCICV